MPAPARPERPAPKRVPDEDAVGRMKNPEGWLRRGVALAHLRQWSAAEKDLQKCIELGLEGPRPWYHLALVRLAAGDRAGYRNACAALWERFGKADSPDTALVLVWTAVAGPNALPDPARLVALAEKAAASPSPRAAAGRPLGAALYRAGQLDRAADQLRATILALGEEASVHEQLFLALAEQRRGHDDQARQWLERAARVLDATPAARGRYDVDAALFWNERLELDLLRREAEALVQPPKP
jgi:tetratricopeptide (TPR) repeat protein